MSTQLDIVGRESAAALRAAVDRTVDTEAALLSVLDADPEVTQHRPHGRRSAVFAGALAVAAVVAIALVVVADGDDDDQEPVDTLPAVTPTSVYVTGAAPVEINVSGPFDIERDVTAPTDVELVPPLDQRVPRVAQWPLDDLTMGLTRSKDCDSCEPQTPLAVVDSTGLVIVAENGSSRFRVVRPDGGGFIDYPVGARVTAMVLGPGDVLYATLEPALGFARAAGETGQLVAYRTSELARGNLTPLLAQPFELPTMELYIDGEAIVRVPSCNGCAAVPAQDVAPLVETDPTPHPLIAGVALPERIAGTTAHHAVLQTEIVGDPPTEVAVFVAADGMYRAIALPASAHNGAWTVDAEGIVVIDIDETAQTWRVIRIPIEP